MSAKHTARDARQQPTADAEDLGKQIPEGAKLPRYLDHANLRKESVMTAFLIAGAHILWKRGKAHQTQAKLHEEVESELGFSVHRQAWSQRIAEIHRETIIAKTRTKYPQADLTDVATLSELKASIADATRIPEPTGEETYSPTVRIGEEGLYINNMYFRFSPMKTRNDTVVMRFVTSRSTLLDALRNLKD